MTDMESLSVREVAVGSGYGAAFGAVLGALFSIGKYRLITRQELQRQLQARAQLRADKHRTELTTVEPQRRLPLPYLVKIPDEVLNQQRHEQLRARLRTSGQFTLYWSLLGACYVSARSGLHNYVALHGTSLTDYTRWQLASTSAGALLGVLGGITRMHSGGLLALTTALGATLGYLQGRASNPHVKVSSGSTSSGVLTVLEWLGIHKMTPEEIEEHKQHLRDKEAMMEKTVALPPKLRDVNNNK